MIIIISKGKTRKKKNYLQLLKSTFKITFILTHTVWGVNKIIKIINKKKKISKKKNKLFTTSHFDPQVVS